MLATLPAIDQRTCPGVYADGNIGFWLCGLLPVRSAYQLTACTKSPQLRGFFYYH